MKKIILLSLTIGLISCSEKTAENSKYSGFISELTKFESGIDSLYQEMPKYPIDSLVSIRENSNRKHKAVKNVYKTDSLDPDYERIMMTTRGNLVKKLGSIESKYSAILNEYTKTSKQVRILTQNLIHETIDEKKAQIFYNEERNAQIILNAELANYIEQAKSTFELYPIITHQLDSIIEQHDL